MVLIFSKVIRRFTGEAYKALVTGDAQQLQLRKRQQEQNYRKWLGLSTEVGEEVEDNPTVYRGKTLEWLVVSDSNIREFTHAEGWSYFQQPADEAERDAHPTNWPCVRVCIDAGSDGLAAVMYLMNAIRCNVDYAPDSANHGLHNDANLAVTDVGMKLQDTMFSQSANLAHSPYNTGQRLEESCDALREWFNVHDHTCVLLQLNLQSILDERGEGHRSAEEGIAIEVWDELRYDRRLRERAAKIAGGRFLQTTSKAVVLCGVWTVTKIRWIIYALATNQLDRTKMDEYARNVAAVVLRATADGQCPGLRSQSKRSEDSWNRVGQNLPQRTIYLLEKR